MGQEEGSGKQASGQRGAEVTVTEGENAGTQ